MNEFDRIARFFAPLAEGYEGARGLKDDAALLTVGERRVITQDTLVETIHFRGDEHPSLLARKALRVNLSDLAAKGATPEAYLLSLALPASCDEAWLEKFCEGLAHDQREFAIHLAGGDSTRSPQHLMMTITAIGTLAVDQPMPHRNGANAGDGIYVTGTIGDGGLGLTEKDTALQERYLLPLPRIREGVSAAKHVSACMDISDGLLQDLTHILTASKVGAELHLDNIPLSPAARAWCDNRDAAQAMLQLATAGDDYELLATAPEHAANTMTKLGFTRIGTITSSSPLTLFLHNEPVPLPEKLGWQHSR